MPHQLTLYKGFQLNASTFEVQGFAPQVCVTRHNGSNSAETILTLPIPAHPYEKSKAALDAAIAYGKAAIDGNVAGFDPSNLT